MRNIIVLFLSLNYLILGIVGHIGFLIAIGFGTSYHYIHQTRSVPTTAKVYWTQNKHIPASIKISVPSPVILYSPELRRNQAYTTFQTLEVIHILPELEYGFHFPRPPPQS
jgi:hypothetical protein